MKPGRILVRIVAVMMLMMAGAWAQDYGPGPSGPSGEAAPGGDGPQPNVARISLIHGDVSMQRGDSGDWEATTVNAPLVRGDQVATGEKSRAEVQLDYANVLRLAARSQAKIADLTRTRIQIQVAQGYASFTQLKGSEADVEIDTPNVAVRPLKHGRYRVQVNSDAETDVIVREGEAEITTPQGSTTVKAGNMIMVRGTSDPEYKIADAPGKDDWDRWNKDRDNAIKDAQSWGRTNRYYTGVHDLDTYGRWVFVPGYGWVWKPYYSDADWAPYRAGRWVWEPYYGWTWVSYEPWGWAPYHYGRWFFYAGSWCWWPGPVYVSYRPVWSPAFVFFVGFGHHATFGFGSIGWFPVGPHDPFYPWWGRGFNRVNVVNVTNITNITNVTNVTNVHNVISPLAVRGRQPYYSNVHLIGSNPRIRGAVTSVGAEEFGRGNFAARRHGIDEHDWHDAKVMTAQLPVVPSRESLRVTRDNLQVPATVQPRTVDRFYTRHQPPAPEPFHTQVERVQRAVGPAAVNAQGNARTDFHNMPAQVERHDAGTNAHAAERGNMEVPRTNGSSNSGAAAGAQMHGEGNGRVGRNEAGNPASTPNEGARESSPGGFRRFGNGGPNNSGMSPGSRPTATENAGSTAGGNEKMAQNTPPANNGNNGGNSSQEKSPNDRNGWRGFGSRRSGAENGNTSHSEQTPGTPMKNDQGQVPRTDNNSGAGHNDSSSWQKFPGAGDRQGSEGRSSQPSGETHNPQPERSASPAQTPRSEDRGWQRFPSNGGSRNNDTSVGRGDSGSKPPLELHRPIVTPRNDSPDSRNDVRSGSGSARQQPSYTPTPQREQPRYTPPPQREQPRYTPPPQRSEPRYSPPPSRSETPRYSPPARSESHESRGGGSSSSHSGSGDRGGHSDSKSSSNPKH